MCSTENSDGPNLNKCSGIELGGPVSCVAKGADPVGSKYSTGSCKRSAAGKSHPMLQWLHRDCVQASPESCYEEVKTAALFVGEFDARATGLAGQRDEINECLDMDQMSQELHLQFMLRRAHSISGVHPNVPDPAPFQYPPLELTQETGASCRHARGQRFTRLKLCRHANSRSTFQRRR